MKYRKKPVIIDAIQWDGTREISMSIVQEFPELESVLRGMSMPKDKKLPIPTLEGTMYASPGDYIIRGVNGEYYPCKPDIFEKTYEKVEE